MNIELLIPLKINSLEWLSNKETCSQALKQAPDCCSIEYQVSVLWLGERQETLV